MRKQAHINILFYGFGSAMELLELRSTHDIRKKFEHLRNLRGKSLISTQNFIIK